MVEIGGILAGISVYMLLYGIKKLTTPVFNLERFIAHKYNVDEDELFLERERELKELQKLYKVDSSKDSPFNCGYGNMRSRWLLNFRQITHKST